MERPVIIFHPLNALVLDLEECLFNFTTYKRWALIVVNLLPVVVPNVHVPKFLSSSDPSTSTLTLTTLGHSKRWRAHSHWNTGTGESELEPFRFPTSYRKAIDAAGTAVVGKSDFSLGISDGAGLSPVLMRAAWYALCISPFDFAPAAKRVWMKKKEKPHQEVSCHIHSLVDLRLKQAVPC